MGGGGKGGTSTSTVSIPPEVLARYNAVNATAENVAKQPFQAYSTDPNAFVAPVNAVQTSGINNIYNAQNAAQPWYQAAGQTYGQAAQSSSPFNYQASNNINTGLGAGAGLTAMGAMPVNAQQIGANQINQFMNPYANDVIAGTLAPLRQQQQLDQQKLLGNAIGAGAFGGDRAGIAQAALQGQQEQATGATVAGLLNPMYSQALGAAQQQQGVNLGAAQANRAALSGAGQQLYNQFTGAGQAQAGLGNQIFNQGVTGANTLAGLGTGAQNAAISGGQAALAAGTVPQQTQQAGLSALYNQFQQQQGYPFQVAQFLANIAEGTGALSGSTTSTTQPTSFFSDARLKEDMETIGETYDGQKIVKFRYKGEKGPKQIGLVAQDVEKHHPDAVGQHQGYKTVDYDKATRDAAARGHFYKGGIVPSSEGGVVHMGRAGEGFAGGGSTASIVDPVDLNALLTSHQNMYAQFNPSGLYGGASPAGGQKGGIVPAGSMPVPKLVTASNVAPQNQATLGSSLHSAVQAGSDVTQGYGMGKAALFGSPATKDDAASKGLIGAGGKSDGSGYLDDAKKALGFGEGSARGGVIPFRRASGGGMPYGNGDESNGYMGSISYDAQSPTQLKNEQESMRQGKTPSTQSSGSALGAAADLYGASKLGKAGFEGAKNLLGTGAASTAPGVGGATGLAAAHTAAEAPLASAIVPEGAAAVEGAGAAAAGAEGAGLLGGIGEGIASFLPFLALQDGGVVPREHHDGPNSTNGQSNVAGDGDGGGGDSDTTANTGRVAPKDLYSHLISQGADPRTALVLTSSAASESGFDPTAKHDFDQNGVPQGYGLFGHQGDRLSAMRQQTGTDTPNWKQQASFALNEMQNPRYQKMIAAAQSPEDLTKVQMHFERPKGYTPDNPEGGHNYSGRVADTNALMPLVLGQDVNWASATKAAAGKPSQGGLGGAGSSGGKDWTDTLTSEKFIVPVLSGLAGMASSPSRYLGAAILQGLGAGAQSYEQLKMQEANIARMQAQMQREKEQSQIGFGNLDVARMNAQTMAAQKGLEGLKFIASRFTPTLDGSGRTIGYLDSARGNQPITVDEYSQIMGKAYNDALGSTTGTGAGKAVTGLPAAANAAVGTAKTITPQAAGQPAPAPAAGQPAPTGQPATSTGAQVASGAEPSVDYTSLDSVNNAMNWHAQNAAKNSVAAPQIAAASNKRVEELQKQAIALSNLKPEIVNQQAYAAAQKQAAEKGATSAIEAQQKAKDAAYANAELGNTLRQQSYQMLDTMFDPVTGKPNVSTGPAAETVQRIAALANQFGVDPELIKRFTNPANAAQIEKNTISMATEIGRSVLGANNPMRQAEFLQFLKSVPSLGISAEAFKHILEDSVLPLADQHINSYKHIQDMDPTKTNIQNELLKYKEDNPWYTPKSVSMAAQAELERRRSMNESLRQGGNQ